MHDQLIKVERSQLETAVRSISRGRLRLYQGSWQPSVGPNRKEVGEIWRVPQLCVVSILLCQESSERTIRVKLHVNDEWWC